MGTIVTNKPNVKWSDIAGLEEAKAQLKEAVELPLLYPHLFKGARKPWKGILLYGPPGTGKTFLAKACATECNTTFFSVSSSDLISKFVGDSEKTIKQLFQLARQKKPSIIFIDEVDSIAGTREEESNAANNRVKTEFLVQMQGVGNNDTGVLVLGATNRPHIIDSAIRRRFEKRIMIPLPDYESRFALFRHELKSIENDLTEKQIQTLAKSTENYSCADINCLVREAVMEPLRKCQKATVFEERNGQFYPAIKKSKYSIEIKFGDIQRDKVQCNPVINDDFKIAMKQIKPSVTQKDLKAIKSFTDEFGLEG